MVAQGPLDLYPPLSPSCTPSDQRLLHIGRSGFFMMPALHNLLPIAPLSTPFPPGLPFIL